MKAYCYASGEVGFVPSAKKIPKGTIVFAKGGGRRFKENVQVRCRLAYPKFIDGVKQPDVWLVPGIPEAENQEEAMDALIQFKSWLQKANAITLTEN